MTLEMVAWSVRVPTCRLEGSAQTRRSFADWSFVCSMYLGFGFRFRFRFSTFSPGGRASLSTCLLRPQENQTLMDVLEEVAHGSSPRCGGPSSVAKTAWT
eukprot:1150963-Pelagomonas_calceolata.AAC.3